AFVAVHQTYVFHALLLIVTPSRTARLEIDIHRSLPAYDRDPHWIPTELSTGSPRTMPSMSGVLRVAVPCPLFQLFDYLPPAGDDGPFRPGMRVRVPFGRGRAVGVIVAHADTSEVPQDKLRRALVRLDDVP